MRFAKGLVAVSTSIAAYSAALAMPGALPAFATTACSPPHGMRMLARRGRVLAWSEPRRQGHGSGTTIVACFRPNGQRRTLYESSPRLWPPSFDHVKTTGAMFAVVVTDGGGFGSAGDLVVSNVRTGQRQFLQQVEFSTDYLPTPYANLVDYGLESAGNVGWIEKVGERQIPPVQSTGSDYLRLHTVAGTRTLEAAPDISYVAIANGAVKWVAGGVRRSAPLVLPGGNELADSASTSSASETPACVRRGRGPQPPHCRHSALAPRSNAAPAQAPRRW